MTELDGIFDNPNNDAGNKLYANSSNSSTSSSAEPFEPISLSTSSATGYRPQSSSGKSFGKKVGEVDQDQETEEAKTKQKIFKIDEINPLYKTNTQLARDHIVKNVEISQESGTEYNTIFTGRHVKYDFTKAPPSLTPQDRLQQIKEMQVKEEFDLNTSTTRGYAKGEFLTDQTGTYLRLTTRSGRGELVFQIADSETETEITKDFKQILKNGIDADFLDRAMLGSINGHKIVLTAAKGINISNETWVDANLADTVFYKCNIDRCTISCNLDRAAFIGCKVSSTYMHISSAKGLIIESASLTNRSDWDYSTRLSGSLNGAKIKGGKFRVDALDVKEAQFSEYKLGSLRGILVNLNAVDGAGRDLTDNLYIDKESVENRMKKSRRYQELSVTSDYSESFGIKQRLEAGHRNFGIDPHWQQNIDFWKNLDPDIEKKECLPMSLADDVKVIWYGQAASMLSKLNMLGANEKYSEFKIFINDGNPPSGWSALEPSGGKIENGLVLQQLCKLFSNKELREFDLTKRNLSDFGLVLNPDPEKPKPAG